ncbi:unnamed protein product [Cuscuta campestris]|uniref:Uncharacterized protein n=1 Tax=Cuscuta campestris TaxID=132261 RepID=A0A484MIN5_9ASTE|nr:unnamed protein product [Cuscuta campestris]
MKKLSSFARNPAAERIGSCSEVAESRRLVTEPEMDAALQLIQLSGDSDSGRYCGDEESVTDATSDEAALDARPPRKRKFRSLVDLYAATDPVLMVKSNNRKSAGKKKFRSGTS